MGADAATYLPTWNRKKKPWPELPMLAQQTASGLIAHDESCWWNVSNTHIVPGDRLFLLKTGDAPVGIFGAGRSRSYSDKTRPHWDEARAAQGDTVNFVDADWEVLLDPAAEQLLTEAAIRARAPGLPDHLWNPLSSGNIIENAVAKEIENAWADHILKVRGIPPSPVLKGEPDELEFSEGKELWRLHRTHERDQNFPRLAKAAAKKRGEEIICCICKFDFFERYGEIGRDFIECHHTIPVSELKPGMKTKLGDVVPVCSNCHRMLHRRRPWLTIDNLKMLLS